MKYQVKDENQDDGDGFDIIEVQIIKERTRACIVKRTVTVWLAVVLLTAVTAAMTGRYSDLQTVLGVVTPLVTMGFGWYLGRTHKT